MLRSQAPTGLVSIVRRTAAALLCVVLAGTLVTAPAVAAPQSQAETQQPPELAPVMLVLDASGSMTEPDPSGLTKMDAAKAAVRALTGQVPAGAQLGLTVYGTQTGNSEAERAAGCQDVQVLHPVGATDAAGIAQAADGIQPSGYTPIGRSLEAAAEALPAEGARSIVLVSDWIDTCAPPDPCEVARQLAQQGVDLQVHTVGFAVDEQARTQLACIAEATGGTYADADELGAALNQVTAAALRVYQASGQAIQGGADQAGAPTVVPGAYLDTQGIGAQDVRWYGIEVPAGFTLYASATVVHQPGADLDDYLAVKIHAPDGSDCFNTGQATGDGPIASTAAVHTVGAQETASAGDLCEQPGLFGVRVERDLGGEPADLELLFGLEPPLAGEPPAAPAAQEVAFTPPSGQPVAVTGGGSFNTATTLQGSGSYTDNLQPGEAVFYRVRLDWGQGFAYQVRFPDGGEGNLVVDTDWWNALRASGDGAHTAYQGDALKLPNTGALATVPVSYANRDAGAPASSASVSGWYYIIVQYGDYGTTRDGAAPVPVTIDLTVSGEPQAAPPYAVPEGEATDAEAVDAFGGESLGAPEPEAAGGDPGAGPLDFVSGRGLLVWGGVALAVLVVILLVVLVLMLAVRGGGQRR
jgi:Ca-activated chloride channel family protein